jgi:hypothetical protein
MAETPTSAARSAKASRVALMWVRSFTVTRSPPCMETASACRGLSVADDKQASY